MAEGNASTAPEGDSDADFDWNTAFDEAIEVWPSPLSSPAWADAVARQSLARNLPSQRLRDLLRGAPLAPPVLRRQRAVGPEGPPTCGQEQPNPQEGLTAEEKQPRCSRPR